MFAGAIVLARRPVVVWCVTEPQRGGALSVFGIFRHAYDIDHDEDMRQEYEDGELVADEDGNVTCEELEAAYKIALKRKA